MDIDWDRVARSPFVVGGIGSLIAAMRTTPGATWGERAFNALSGAAAAGFVTPALVEWLAVKSPAVASGAAFVLGLLSMSLTAAVLQGIKDTPVGQIITGWVSRRPGSDGGAK